MTNLKTRVEILEATMLKIPKIETDIKWLIKGMAYIVTLITAIGVKTFIL